MVTHQTFIEPWMQITCNILPHVATPPCHVDAFTTPNKLPIFRRQRTPPAITISFTRTFPFDAGLRHLPASASHGVCRHLRPPHIMKSTGTATSTSHGACRRCTTTAIIITGSSHFASGEHDTYGYAASFTMDAPLFIVVFLGAWCCT